MVAVLRAPGSGARDVIFSRDGDAAVGNAGHRWYAERDLRVRGVLASAGTAPLGADLVFDVLLDGAATMFTTTANRPKIVAGTNEGLSPAPDVVLVPQGHWVEVVTVQTGVAPNLGSKIDVRILYE